MRIWRGHHGYTSIRKTLWVRVDFSSSRLIFSQSLTMLNVIEYFLSKSKSGSTDSTVGKWRKDRDYFRLDGQTKENLRSEYCKLFNEPKNTRWGNCCGDKKASKSLFHMFSLPIRFRARLFLISTKAGGIGINLTGANRVIIFDASWNPSSDIQSIFRICRVGQTKPCYIYRFLAQVSQVYIA